jgi:murein L,D-transpeptidase YafK
LKKAEFVLRLSLLLFLLFIPTSAIGMQKADFVLVIKSESTLYLMRHGKALKRFHVVFGRHPKGRKLREGDERTPEGRYILDYKNEDSPFYKSIHISYPNRKDKRLAKELGVNPGGQIMIHGQKNNFIWPASITQLFNWTDGCIALSNRDMDKVWDAVDIGTPILIIP